MAKRKSLGLEWCPTAPADFLKLGRSEQAKNYPDMRQAYIDAVNQKYPEAVVFETAKRVGFWEIRTQSEAVTWKRWQEIYPQVCAEHASGAEFALPKEKQLEYSHTPLQPNSPMAAKVEEFLAQFKRKGAGA
ncbi:hypothetical protein [Psychrobacter sp. I-STPA6b]|uniref:hypothetical protein n=1 Tax=Psychrobacter sp. I-STPA6b TaxID=2585718 RepID=UPI001D0C0A56|nr:hypothetical protein [Psychrobacter sp. I-STPA6b]